MSDTLPTHALSVRQPWAWLICSGVVMGKRGVLSAAHSRWLMGYPEEWGRCWATLMRLSRRWPRNSSRRGILFDQFMKSKFQVMKGDMP